MKQVVTGHTPKGDAVILSEAEVNPVCPTSIPGYRTYELWSTSGPRTIPHSGPLPGVPSYFPSEEGSVFRILDLPPASAGAIDAGTLAEELPRLLPGFVEHLEADNPGMHTTDSIDYVLVMSGEVFLELDNHVEVRLEAGDVVIQNGTRHAWRNRTDAPVRMAAVQLGARRTGPS